MMEEMSAKVYGRQEEMLARMREDIKSGQAEMRSTICAFQCELEETIQQEMKDFLWYVDQKTQNLLSELAETIEKARGVTDSKVVPRQTNTGRREKYSIHQGRYYL
jgi:hypothetical protein